MTTPGIGMTSQSTLSGKGVETGLQRRYWDDAKIGIESILADPIFGPSEMMSDPVMISNGMAPVSLPSGVVVDMTPPTMDGKAARDVTVPFLQRLQGDGLEGNGTELPGSEENRRVKYSKFYANDYSHGVPSDKFGIGQREQAPLRLDKRTRKDLTVWLGEKRSRWLRQTICECRSSTLAAAPLSLAQPINPNVYLMGTTTSNQPTYDKDKSDWDNEVGSHLSTYGTSSMQANIPNLLDLIDFIVSKYGEPIRLPGGFEGYIYAAPQSQVTRNLNPDTDKGWAKYWTSANGNTDLKKVIPGAQIIIRNRLLVVEDLRCPTLVSAGVGSTYTNAFGYMGCGRNDGRTATKATAGYYDCGYVLCNRAIGKYEPEMPHFEFQADNYTKNRGDGLFGAVGYSLIMNDIDTATDTSMQHEGSFLVPTWRP